MNRLITAITKSTHKVLLPTTASNSYKRAIASTPSNRLFSNRATNKMDGGTATIAIGQMRSTNDKNSNRVQVQEIVKLAVQQNASFVFLPECCDYVGSNRDEVLALAETLNGDTVNYYKELARTNNVWLSLGGIHESIHDDNGEPTDKLYNAHVVVNSSGEVAAVYRKLHLFDVQTPEFTFRESQSVVGGNKIVAPLTDTPLPGGLGLLICYDLRFAELSTILRKNGANFLTYPSAFAYSTGLAHWESLLRARAIENQCYVIAPAQIGFHNEKRQSFGHAMVIDPWGKILTECDDNVNDVQCNVVTIDVGDLMAIRQRMPCFEHRRNDVYALAPIQMTSPASSIVEKQLPRFVEVEQTPHFIFEKYPVPESTVFYETPQCVAFTNVSCVVPGHVLVASRRCVARLKQLSPEEIMDFFMTVCKCQRMLEHYYDTTSSTVTVQDGEFAGQTVKHVHCHIMPRKKDDFAHNDEIYIELNKHDHGEVRRPQRTVDERTSEANAYRKLLETFKAFGDSENNN